uniref:Uncharacterized protein n=1 Tax=Anguilla anguilla TaxID=7936 RepID=A0A0E9X1Y6_ANGAN
MLMEFKVKTRWFSSANRRGGVESRENKGDCIYFEPICLADFVVYIMEMKIWASGRACLSRALFSRMYTELSSCSLEAKIAFGTAE